MDSKSRPDLAVTLTGNGIIRGVTASCANENSNFGLGGVDGAVVLDLRNLKNFTMDHSTWQASIGGGMHLGELDAHLHANGGRAMAHGTCSSVGVGGHFTIVSSTDLMHFNSG
jgi:hypothetical protein